MLSEAQLNTICLTGLATCVICTIGYFRLARAVLNELPFRPTSLLVSLSGGTVMGFWVAQLVQYFGNRSGIFGASSTLADGMVGVSVMLAVSPMTGWLILWLWLRSGRRPTLRRR